MGFVEAMAIEVSRATTPDRPIQQVPFPRFTYDEVIERFGSDKPDVRFGMELVDLAPALGDESGFKVFDEALAAGGRVKAIVAPGMAGITRREIDELTDRSGRRVSPTSRSRPVARSRARSPSSCPRRRSVPSSSGPGRGKAT